MATGERGQKNMKNCQKTFKVVVKEVNKPAEVRELVAEAVNTRELEHAELKLFQKLVGGYVELFHVTEDVKIICNEEGLLQNLPWNIDRFVGTILFVGEQDCNKGLKDGHSRLEEDTDEMREWCSLTDEQVRKALAWCEKRSGLPRPPMPKAEFRIITDPQEMKAHTQRLREEAIGKVREWEAL